MDHEIKITPGKIPQGGPEIMDTVDPSDLSDPMAAIAACFKCVTAPGIGSVEPLRDIQACRSESCPVWSARIKALRVIAPGPRNRGD